MPTTPVALDFGNLEFQAILAKLGMEAACVVFAADPLSRVWATNEVWREIGADLTAAGAGEFDSLLKAPDRLYCFFILRGLAHGLTTLKDSLSARDLLSIATIAVAEPEEKAWKVYSPPEEAAQSK